MSFCTTENCNELLLFVKESFLKQKNDYYILTPGLLVSTEKTNGCLIKFLTLTFTQRYK